MTLDELDTASREDLIAEIRRCWDALEARARASTYGAGSPAPVPGCSWCDQPATVVRGDAQRVGICAGCTGRAVALHGGLGGQVEAETAALRTQLGAVTRERDEARADAERLRERVIFAESAGVMARLAVSDEARASDAKYGATYAERDALRVELGAMRAAAAAYIDAVDAVPIDCFLNVSQDDDVRRRDALRDELHALLRAREVTP